MSRHFRNRTGYRQRRSWLNRLALTLLLVVAATSGACSSNETEPGAAVADSTTSSMETPENQPTTASSTAPSTEATKPTNTSKTTATSQSAAGPDATGPSFGTLNTSFVSKLVQSDDDEPFFMLNLIAFRDQAIYADGRETNLTGKEANDLYTKTGVQKLFEGGMRPAMFGTPIVDPTRPSDSEWDQVAIARYPSYAEFFALTSDPEFQEGSEHKDAGVETSTVMVTKRIVDSPPASELPSAEAPVIFFELFSHDGNGTNKRPETLSKYLDDLAPLATANNGVALGTYEVVGTFIGDGREWDEAHLWWFPNQTGLDGLLADPQFEQLTSKRDADLDDLYRLSLEDAAVEPMGREP